MDAARKIKQVLYVLYIDYQKTIMSDTYTAIGNEKFKSTTGIKQGSAISFALFSLYLDHTIRAVRQYGNDGFLQECHILFAI